MSKVRCTRLVVMLLLTPATVQAAPILPLNTEIQISVHGDVYVSDGAQFKDANFESWVTAREFTSGGNRVSAEVVAGGVPGFDHVGMVGALGGVQFEQVAPNEYLLTLSSGAYGELVHAGASPFDGAQFQSNSEVRVRSDFEVFGLPGQTNGDPARVLLTFGHVGSVSLRNLGEARNWADVQVTASEGEPFYYSDSVEVGWLPCDNFDECEFVGRRHTILESAISTYVGGVISVDAVIQSDSDGFLGDDDQFMSAQAASDFDQGMWIHMSVVPEPSTLALGMVGAIALLKRPSRRSRASAK